MGEAAKKGTGGWQRSSECIRSFFCCPSEPCAPNLTVTIQQPGPALVRVPLPSSAASLFLVAQDRISYTNQLCTTCRTPY